MGYGHWWGQTCGTNADDCALFIQRLGECLGKGAFGSVYKAFNWGTGEAVAVKQIKLADLPKSELRMIEVGCLPSETCRPGLLTRVTLTERN